MSQVKMRHADALITGDPMPESCSSCGDAMAPALMITCMSEGEVDGVRVRASVRVKVRVRGEGEGEGGCRRVLGSGLGLAPLSLRAQAPHRHLDPRTRRRQRAADDRVRQRFLGAKS